MNAAELNVGRYVTGHPADGKTRVLCDVPELRQHVERPWFRSYMSEQLGLPVLGGDSRGIGPAVVADDALARHTMIIGSTGSGKSRLMLHTLVQQVQAGHSVVLIDPKGETYDRLLALVQQRRVLASEQITLLDPRYPDGSPGWNPFATGVALSQTVADTVAVIEATSTSWGARLEDLLTNALLVVGARRLSLYEVVQVLVNDDYRQGLLRHRVVTAEPLAYHEAQRFLEREFSGWSRSDRAQAVGPVLNKIREFLRSGFLHPLLCSRRNTLDLGSLWRRPQLVCVRLDRAVLGEAGTRLLIGLLCNSLFRTALRASGTVPVVLALDELPSLARYAGSAIEEIATVARSLGLRLIVAAQHLAQLPESLRAALLSNAAVQVFLRLGHADARLVGASLAVGGRTALESVTVGIDAGGRRTGQPDVVSVRHPIRDADGRALRVPTRTWERLHWDGIFSGSPLAGVERLAVAAQVPRLYVAAADSGVPVALHQYIAGIPPTTYWVDGPSLSLVVAFPRPKFTGIERSSESDLARFWTARLQDLPVQHGVLRIAGQPPATIRIADVPSTAREPEDSPFLARCRRANGQSVAEIQDTLAWREAEVERVASGRSVVEVADGSIA